MHLHSALEDPLAVFVMRAPVSATPTAEEFQRAAREALGAMALELRGEKVALKPNVTSGEQRMAPESGIQTHHAFIGGLVEYLAAHGARRGGIYVVEDPLNHDNAAPRQWRGTGYPEMAAATGAKLRCPSPFTCVKRTVPRPLVHPVRHVSRYAVMADGVLINVPKLKTHNLGILTLCMKNLMGLDNVYDRHYCGQAMREFPPEMRHEHLPREEWMDQAMHERWQEGLARRLIDLAQVIQPRLNVIEGVVGRDGTAFQHGNNYPLGLVVAGVNMVAVDSVAGYLMGFDPRRVIYLRLAAEHGLGCNDLSRLRCYTAAAGKLAPCHDLASFRANPPFRVITNTRGEPPGGTTSPAAP